MCQISNVIIVFQCWSASMHDSIQMDHRCGSRCTSFFWNSLSILSGLLADTENPMFVSDYGRLTSAPSVLFWVSELAHFPSMLVQSFSTHFGQSPLVVLLFGSHALGLAACQRWGTFPGSRCVDRPLFHIHLTQRGAIFKVCVFAIEFMVLYILKLPPIFGQMERWRHCAYAGYNRLRDQHIVHLQTCKGHWKITPALSISASIQSKSEIRKESKKALQSLRLKGSPVLNSSCICFALKAHLPTMLCGN